MDSLQKFTLVLVSVAVICFLCAAPEKCPKPLRVLLVSTGILVLLFLGGCHYAIRDFNSHF